MLFVGNSFIHRNNKIAMLNELSKRDDKKGEYSPFSSLLLGQRLRRKSTLLNLIPFCMQRNGMS